MSKKKCLSPGKRGYALPLGATIRSDGINFALFARHARSVALVIEFTSSAQKERFTFQLSPQCNKTGDIWHILLPFDWREIRYGYAIDGNHSATKGLYFTKEAILMDPYCTVLQPRSWGESALYGQAPVCQVTGDDFDWKDETPLLHPLQDSIIYELHVRGFTRSNSSQCANPGTYSGLIEKIPYLQELGITAVELMPVAEFDENDTVFFDPATGQRHKNFWGYNSINFFALKSGYAADPTGHLVEFKKMVQAFHRAGIEIILDIVFNHTGESGYDGTTSSFRGIDNPVYYLLDPDTDAYLNFSGCGNTTNCNHPIFRELICASLRYWVTEMHIDGFRFDLASILGRDKFGNVLSDAPVLEQIAEDPVLRNTKIIAEAWDAAGLYQVGSFSTDSRWSEWNGKFRDDVRAFFTGQENTVAKIATRIAGSADLYQKGTRGPANSINFITSHDGFTLYDLVSYDTKHNLNNGENNRDGENHNCSWNSGIEGKSSSELIEKFRFRRMKSMTAILLLSQGVPMITGGDEMGRSQQGNNNNWCQDNESSWIDWNLVNVNHDLLAFFKLCIQLRRQHPVFRRGHFFSEKKRDISWQASSPGEVDWSPSCHHLGYLLDGSDLDDDHFFIMLNGNRDKVISFMLPQVPGPPDETSAPQQNVSRTSPHESWHLCIDTTQPTCMPKTGKKAQPIPHPLPGGTSLHALPMSVMVFQSPSTAKRKSAVPSKFPHLVAIDHQAR